MLAGMRAQGTGIECAGIGILAIAVGVAAAADGFVFAEMTTRITTIDGANVIVSTFRCGFTPKINIEFQGILG
jgi:hypothetical protein